MSEAKHQRWSVVRVVDGVLAARHDHAARMRNVDLLAVIVAASLPWSTSAVAIGSALWLIALLWTLDLRALWQLLKRPICVWPLALVVLAAIATLWSNVPWETRLYAVGPTLKLLFIPALLFHFQRSSRGWWVFAAFFASCTVLMIMSWLVAFAPSLALKPNATYGVPVKNYIDQSQEFALCAIAPLFLVMSLLRAGRFWQAALLGAIAAGFLINMTFVAVSRTALVTLPLMLGLFALFHLRWRTSVALLAATTVLGSLVWANSPKLQQTTAMFFSDYTEYKLHDEPTSMGLRLEFWKKSLGFFAEAPVFGNGTGATRSLFEKAAARPVVGKTLASDEVIANPHNQTLAVAVQWGAIGVVVLYAMWLSHLLLFRGNSFAGWVGLLVVVQNVLTSLFNSHLFDFHEGWMYVLGVGVAGGMVLGERLRGSP